MQRIYAIVNQKGGVGKTTTSINLAAYLANAGKRVLLVDLDSQANATSSLGADKYAIEGGTYSALVDDEDFLLNDHILTNETLKVDLLPATPDMAGAELEMAGLEQREFRLRLALQNATDYDYILIDCPPSLGLLTLNGLTAAQQVLIPMQGEYLALEGLGQLLNTIERVRAGLNPALSIRGILLTMFDPRSTLAQDVQAEIEKHFPQHLFSAIIPRNVRLAEAPSHGLPILFYSPTSKGAQAYQELANELLRQDEG
ncbi:MAG TPA: ParA family protein [Anaerolineales bacterium]|nr:ParA family protein [Anaerolineales bacterium]